MTQPRHRQLPDPDQRIVDAPGPGELQEGSPGRLRTTAQPRTRTPSNGIAAPGQGRRWPKSFEDRLTAPLPGLRSFARFAREGAVRPKREGLADIPRIPYRPEPLPPVDARQVAVSWAGHASWVIRIGGLTVLADPVWSRRILGTPARVTPVGVAWDALPPVDAVVISHNHYDHLDLPTLRRLPSDTPMFVPGGLGRWFARKGFGRVVELDWWESARLGRVRLDFVPAHHWSKRTLTDTCRSLWGGWMLTADPDADPDPGPDLGSGSGEGGRRRVYFAGDTGYGHWFRRIGERYPGIDLALMPIGAYEPRWWLRDVHCDPEEAVRATQDVGARRMAPMHWGTFLLSSEPVMEPLHRVREAWEAAGRNREDLWDLPVGGSRVLGDGPLSGPGSGSRRPGPR
jgi:L-ascorbate metabolism protein UlaG (beta-lactamase superfamily)